MGFACLVQCTGSKNKLKLNLIYTVNFISNCCAGELGSILDRMESEIELGDLKITFDLNCLTLPVDVEETSPRRPAFNRMSSEFSVSGNSDSGSDTGETVDRSSFSQPYAHLLYNHETHTIQHCILCELSKDSSYNVIICFGQK